MNKIQESLKNGTKNPQYATALLSQLGYPLSLYESNTTNEIHSVSDGDNNFSYVITDRFAIYVIQPSNFLVDISARKIIGITNVDIPSLFLFLKPDDFPQVTVKVDKARFVDSFQKLEKINWEKTNIINFIQNQNDLGNSKTVDNNATIKINDLSSANDDSENSNNRKNIIGFFPYFFQLINEKENNDVTMALDKAKLRTIMLSNKSSEIINDDNIVSSQLDSFHINFFHNTHDVLKEVFYNSFTISDGINDNEESFDNNENNNDTKTSDDNITTDNYNDDGGVNEEISNDEASDNNTSDDYGYYDTSDDGRSDEETSDNEISNDGMSNDGTSDNEISDKESYYTYNNESYDEGFSRESQTTSQSKGSNDNSGTQSNGKDATSILKQENKEEEVNNEKETGITSGWNRFSK